MSEISIHNVKSIIVTSRKHPHFTATAIEVSCEDEIYEKITLFSDSEIFTSMNGKKVEEKDYSHED